MDKKTAVLVMFREGNSIRKIVESLNISRNTVRNIIRSYNTDHTPKKYKRLVQHYPILQNYIADLDKMLEHDLTLHTKSRRSCKRYYTQLTSQGYQGGYDSVRRYVKKWYEQHTTQLKNSFIPLYFEPAEAYQFDWSEEIVELAGKTTKIKVAHFKLCYSRMFFIRAYIRETQEMLFDAHDKAFAFFGGLTSRGIYDNMKTAVDRVFIGKNNRQFNQYFLCLMSHYAITPTACNPASGWEKGQIENQVDNIRDWIFKPRLKFDSLQDLNQHLENRCLEIAHKRKHPELKDQSIHEVFKLEKLKLREFNSPFNGYREYTRQANSLCMVNYDTNAYSVDCIHANKQVDVRVYPEKIIIVSKREIIGQHARSFDRHKRILDPYHYVDLLDRKPGALKNGLPFKDWKLPESILKVKAVLMSKDGGDKEMSSILVALKEYGVEAVEVACDLALHDAVVNSQYILNYVTRLNCQEKSETIDVENHLHLKEPPTADCKKYNQLLAGRIDG